MPKIYGFEEAEAKRIKGAVFRHENYYQNRAPKGARFPVAGSGAGLLPAKCTSTIAAGSVSSPASFTATLFVFSSGGPGFTASSNTVTAYNPYTSSITANALIWLANFGGNYYVVAANC